MDAVWDHLREILKPSMLFRPLGLELKLVKNLLEVTLTESLLRSS